MAACIGVVLAGGQSRRMGTDKALLRRRQASMLQWTRQLLSRCCERVLTSGHDDTGPVIQDIYPNKGPLAGIHAVASRYPHHSLLVVPVDMPRLSVALLTHLQQQGLKAGCSAHYQDHYLPLFLFNQAQERHYLQQRLCQGQGLSVRALCQHQGALVLDAEQPGCLVNCNTPQQWQLAMAGIYQEEPYYG